jgi:hypothetical protein
VFGWSSLFYNSFSVRVRLGFIESLPSTHLMSHTKVWRHNFIQMIPRWDIFRLTIRTSIPIKGFWVSQARTRTLL